ncbi:lytic polysaccharide monooxygenase [Polaribacter cellanae]|uniref:Lytic polysaccharide monooxygenase n=1 Tax=Polaribacter cellanae TaxID=2818493 RepID=A0A975H680_9FLAO|nr:lytic polysaccharide monooxygenase [Polaribacter cellanae]QTE21718.1 lytic polysaccharide monooxygenase [Polaribacter cellanae]
MKKTNNYLVSFLSNKTSLSLIRKSSNNKLFYSSIILFFVSIFPQSIFSHGTVTSPASRIWQCRFLENPENPTSKACMAAVASHGTQPFYDWSAVRQGNANGDHQRYILDGNLASGGDPDKYGGLDQVRSDWVATSVSPGPFTVTWYNKVGHKSEYYRVYITKEGWSPNKPLAWGDLELLAETGPKDGKEKYTVINVTLPKRTGKHVIYSIWQNRIGLSAEAFYSTSDIDFGNTLSVNEYNEQLAKLNQNYPNPFAVSSKIGYTIRKEGNVSLKVYDILGKEVATLVDGYQTAGDYNIIFKNETLDEGVYFYVFKLDSYIETKKMILKK